MADDNARNELAQLRAEVAALKARVDRTPSHHSRRRSPRRFLPLALVALLVALMPLSLLAASPFNDLSGGVHDVNIGLIYDAGITRGCVPNVSYCPAANVTREEMASFLARTAGLGANPPVVNAKTAQTATHATSADTANGATNATTAANANTVGGYAPTGLARVAQGAGSPPTTMIGSGSYVTLASVTITVPGAGYVLVTGAASLFSTSSSCGCEVSVRLHDLGAGGGISPSLSAYVGLAYNAARSQSASPTYVFPVTAAGPRTFVLEAAGAVGTQSYVGQMVTALYVPFNGGGTTP